MQRDYITCSIRQHRHSAKSANKMFEILMRVTQCEGKSRQCEKAISLCLGGDRGDRLVAETGATVESRHVALARQTVWEVSFPKEKTFSLSLTRITPKHLLNQIIWLFHLAKTVIRFSAVSVFKSDVIPFLLDVFFRSFPSVMDESAVMSTSRSYHFTLSQNFGLYASTETITACAVIAEDLPNFCYVIKSLNKIKWNAAKTVSDIKQELLKIK